MSPNCFVIKAPPGSANWVVVEQFSNYQQI